MMETLMIDDGETVRSATYLRPLDKDSPGQSNGKGVAVRLRKILAGRTARLEKEI